MTPLPFDSVVDEYQRQADAVFDGWQSGDEQAVKFFRAHHPKFLDDKVPWLQRFWESDADARAIPVSRDDARLAVARLYDFLDWPSLETYANAVADRSSAVSRFEHAAEAVIDGDAVALRRMLAADPDLVRARSTRVCNFDPPVHRATLLHYVAANGVESYRQRTPKNAVEIATLLLDAGADPNALQGSYGSENTTMAMLVSSSHPRQAGLQVPLLETLIDYGAAVGPLGSGTCADPLICALVFGSVDAAEALVRRGARIDSLAKAAGLGLLDAARALLPGAGDLDRHRALAVAAMLGRLEIVTLLLDAGEDLNRFNPEGYHAHATPLHQSIAQGHFDVARLLIERGARLDIKDNIFRSTPLGWAEYCQQPRIAALLKEHLASGHTS
jgi:ankyrin repeat protein